MSSNRGGGNEPRGRAAATVAAAGQAPPTPNGAGAPKTEAADLPGTDPRQLMSGPAPRVRLLIYGDSGVGKSDLVATIPTAYFADSGSDQRPGRQLDAMVKAGSRIDYVASLDALYERVRRLARGDHPLRTLVIDNWSDLWDRFEDAWSDRLATDRDPTGMRFQSHRDMARKFTRRMLELLRHVDMNVVVVCRERNQHDGGKLVSEDADCDNEVSYAVDVTLRMSTTAATGRTLEVKKTKLPGFTLGARFSATMPELAQRLEGTAFARQEMTPYNIASPEQVAMAEEYLKAMPLRQGETATAIQRWLYDRARVMSMDLMTVEQIDGVVTWAKRRIAQADTPAA